MKKAGLIDKAVLGKANLSELAALQERMAIDTDARYDFHDVNYIIINSSANLKAARDESYYDGLGQIQFSIGQIKRRRNMWTRARSWCLILICIACLVFCLFFWISKPAIISFDYADNGFTHVHRTALPDGSTVVLRGNSSLFYYHIPFVRILRISGDAYVEVYDNSKKPFYLLNGLGTIRSTRSAFYTRIYQGQFAKVFVTRGVADVRYQEQHFSIGTGENITLLQSATLGKSTQLDPNFNAWYTGNLVFSHTRLDDIVFTLETQFNVIIELKDLDVKGRYFTETFHKPASVDEILEVLCTRLEFDYHLERPRIYVLKGRSTPPNKTPSGDEISRLKYTDPSI